MHSLKKEMSKQTAVKHKPIIGIIGDGRLDEDSSKYTIAYELGKQLVENGYRICCGGLGGVMEAVCKGAKAATNASEGDTIGILPGFNPASANIFVDIPIATGLDITRNMIISNCDAVIAIGGGAGTLSEIALAWQLKRLIIAFKVEGWSGKLADTRIDERDRFKGNPTKEEDRIFGVDATEEALYILDKKLKFYKKRHRGIPD